MTHRDPTWIVQLGIPALSDSAQVIARGRELPPAPAALLARHVRPCRPLGRQVA